MQLPDQSDTVYECNSAIIFIEEDNFFLEDSLIVNGEIYTFDAAVNEGMFDLKNYYASMQIDFAVTDSQIRLNERPLFSISENLYCLRQQLCSVTELYLQEEMAGILNSILFGDKSQLDTETKNLYRNAGISHILAISGLHVSMIGMALYQLLRKKRCSYLLSALAAGILLLAYCEMTGNGISTLRAAGMLLLTMAGAVLGRQTDSINSLGLMILLLLWENPYLVNSSSFIFSVTAILGITVTGKAFAGPVSRKEQENDGKRDTEPDHKTNITTNTKTSSITNSITNSMKNGKADGIAAIRRWMADTLPGSLSMSLSINLTTLPLTAWYYYEFPLYSVFLNLLVLPLLNLLFISGLSGTLCGYAVNVLAGYGSVFLPVRLLFLPAAIILQLFRSASTVCMELPFAQIVTGQPSPARLISYYLLLGGVLLALWYYRNKSERAGRLPPGLLRETMTAAQKHRMQLRMLSGRAIMVTSLLLLLIFPRSRSFEITLLDVGQGDGIYLCTQDGTSFMIDGGSVTEDEIGTYRLLPFLKCRGLGQLDYWFVSHGDQDHYSGLIEVLESGYPVKYLILSDQMMEDDAYEEIRAAAEAAGTEVLEMKQGDCISTGTATLTCIYPGSEESSRFDDRNDLCLTLLLDQELPRSLTEVLEDFLTGGSAEHYRALFAGDISSEAEEILVSGNLTGGSVDFYKVCHHGSKYSSSAEFLEFLQPEIAVISCGLQNTYGHPSPEAVERIKSSGAEIYYTMYSGEIRLYCRRGKIRITSFKKAS